MSTETTPVAPDVQIFLTAAAFAEARNQVSDIRVQHAGLVAAAAAVEYELPAEGQPMTIIIGTRREVLPFLKVGRTILHSNELLTQPDGDSELTDTELDEPVLTFYTDGWTSEQVSRGLAAAMQFDTTQSLRERTVEHIALGFMTTSVAGIAEYADAPLPATTAIVLLGGGALVKARIKHRRDAKELLAKREAATASRPLVVVMPHDA